MLATRSVLALGGLLTGLFLLPTAAAEIPTVSVCELVRDGRLYDNRLVRVPARLQGGGVHGASLVSEKCRRAGIALNWSDEGFERVGGNRLMHKIHETEDYTWPGKAPTVYATLVGVFRVESEIFQMPDISVQQISDVTIRHVVPLERPIAAKY
jgi:hypothetical protein